MLKIYGADLSSPANKVRFVANALELEYEYVQVNIREKQNRTPEYLAMHPAGKIPVIDDDGFVLFESGAIIKYLAEKVRSPLYPTDIQQRALIDQWIDFGTIHINGAMGRVLFNRIFVHVLGIPVDENSLKDGLNFLDKFLPVVDQQLGKSAFLAGGSLSLADMNLLAALDPCEVGQIDLSSYTNIVSWRNKLKQESFYTKCHKEYGEKLKHMQS